MEAMRKKEIQIQQEKRKSNKLVKNKVIYGSISPPSKSDVKVSFHPAEVGIPNKERGSRFQIRNPKTKKSTPYSSSQ